jgi:hypothetical protein
MLTLKLPTPRTRHPARSRAPTRSERRVPTRCHPDRSEAQRAKWRACPERTPSANEGESNGDLLFARIVPRPNRDRASNPNVVVCGGSHVPTLSHRTRKDGAPSKSGWTEKVGSQPRKPGNVPSVPEFPRTMKGGPPAPSAPQRRSGAKQQRCNCSPDPQMQGSFFPIPREVHIPTSICLLLIRHRRVIESD